MHCTGMRRAQRGRMLHADARLAYCTAVGAEVQELETANREVLSGADSAEKKDQHIHSFRQF